MNLDRDSVLVQDREPTATELDDGVVLLSLRAGAYFGLNRVGSEIWRMLAAPCRVGQVFDALLARHEVDGEQVARDVTPFLQALIEHGLVRPVTAGGPR